MRIIVLYGGDSPEREISLKSGRQVIAALRKNGHKVFPLDPAKRSFAKKILEIKPDCVFIALHGGKGEGGPMQGFLETLNIPHTGSNMLSSALCLNKILTKQLLALHNIPVPDFIVLEKLSVPAKLPWELPVVVKGASLGSSIGTSIVRNKKNLLTAIRKSFELDNEVFIEKYVDGKEVTVSIMGNDNPIVLPTIEIKTFGEFYDFEAKYIPGKSIHQIPPDIPEKTLKYIEDISLRAYKILYCRGCARAEIIVDKNNCPYMLEVNTIPGLTKTSLFPDSAKAHGMSFKDMCEEMIRLATEKHE